jgi:hypothetical protein
MVSGKKVYYRKKSDPLNLVREDIINLWGGKYPNKN